MPTLPGLPQGREPEPDARAEKEAQAARDAADKGILVESGWLGLRAVWISDQASAVQIDEMRNAFFAGAQHMQTSMSVMPEPGLDATAKDLERMDKIAAELSAFFERFKEKRLPPGKATVHLAMGHLGATSSEIAAFDGIDRALRDFAQREGKLTARDLALLLTGPLYKLATHSPEDIARATIEAMRTGLDALEEQVAKRHPPKPKEHF